MATYTPPNGDEVVLLFDNETYVAPDGDNVILLFGGEEPFSLPPPLWLLAV